MSTPLMEMIKELDSVLRECNLQNYDKLEPALPFDTMQLYLHSLGGGR